MKRLHASLCLCIVLTSLSFTSFANPCEPIAKACKEAGFYKGGNKVGKGLVENCVMPIVNHQNILDKVTFPSKVLQDCKTVIMNKMQAN